MIFMKSAGKNSLSSELMLPQSYLEGLGLILGRKWKCKKYMVKRVHELQEYVIE